MTVVSTRSTFIPVLIFLPLYISFILSFHCNKMYAIHVHV